MKRLGVSRTIQKSRYTASRVARRLGSMLEKQNLFERSLAVAEQLRGEDGVRTACDALEALYAKTKSR